MTEDEDLDPVEPEVHPLSLGPSTKRSAYQFRLVTEEVGLQSTDDDWSMFREFRACIHQVKPAGEEWSDGYNADPGNEVAYLEGFIFDPDRLGDSEWSGEEIEDKFDQVDQEVFEYLALLDQDDRTQPSEEVYAAMGDDPIYTGKALILRKFEAKEKWRGLGVAGYLMAHVLAYHRQGAAWAALRAAPIDRAALETMTREEHNESCDRLMKFYQRFDFATVADNLMAISFAYNHSAAWKPFLDRDPFGAAPAKARKARSKQ